MESWRKLATVALVGTEQSPPEAAPPAVFGNVQTDQLLVDLAKGEKREVSFLHTAAALTLLRRAGHLPAKSGSVPSPSAEESLKVCSVQAGDDLRKMVRGFLPEVLPDWLRVATRLNLRVSPDLLPELMELAAKKKELRALIEPVLGERGKWLAGQNETWSFFFKAEDLEKTWHEGKTEERVAALKAMRAQDAAKGRDWLEKTWKDEGAAERRAFLGAMEPGLSLADEPFLESLLDKATVAKEALALLYRLPESKAVQKITGWCTPLLQISKSMFGGTSLTATLPEEPTQEMNRYGIGIGRFITDAPEVPRANDTGGKRERWLIEMLEVIPPSHWCVEFKLPAKKIIEALAITTKQPAAIGLALAASHSGDNQWREAFLEFAKSEKWLGYAMRACEGRDRLPADMEPAVMKHVQANEGYLHFDKVMQILGNLPQPWGENLSTAIVMRLWTEMQPYFDDSTDKHKYQQHQWRRHMRRCAAGINCFVPKALIVWPKTIDEAKTRAVVDEFCQMVEFRRTVITNLKK